MYKSLAFLQKNLGWTVPLFMVAGFILGLSMEDPGVLKIFILPLTFLMVYPMMVTLQFKKILEGGDFKVQAVTQIINFAVIPFLAFFLGKLFFSDHPYLALGFLLVSLLPTSGMTISWTGMSKGNMPAAVKMTVVGLLLGSVLTPFYIQWLMGSTISIPMTKIFTQIVVVVALPMVVGFITRQLLIARVGMARFQKDIKKLFPPFSTLGVLLMVFTAMAIKAHSIMANPMSFISLIPALLALYLINFILSTIIAKVFFNRGDGLALVYGTVLRNLSIALAIAMTSFGKEGSDIALIIALGYIIQIQLSSWYVKLSPRLFGPPEDDKAEELMHRGVFALHNNNTLREGVKLLAEEHIISIAVIDEQNKPIGMLDSDMVIDVLAEDISVDTPLGELTLSPVVTVEPENTVKEIMDKMRRNHEYKVLLLDKAGLPSHVISRDDILKSIHLDLAKKMTFK